MSSIRLSDHFTYRRILRFCLSPICMMVFTSVYGVVDGLFISNFVGKIPFAAINLVMPFIMILGGVGFMIAAGGSALVSQTLGEGDRDRAERYFTMMVQLTVVCGLVLGGLGILFMPQISRLLGATDLMLSDCVLYGRTVLAFNVAFMLQNIFQVFFVTAERPKLGLYATLAAGFTNMGLDALFVAIFRWGVAGAAVATGISQCIGGILPLFYFLSSKNGSLLRLRRTRPEGRVLLRACANGSSELMSNVSSSVVSMVYNFQLLAYAGENGVASYGVLMYIQFIFVAIFIGYTIGVSPVVGYHYGAENWDELKNVFHKSLRLMIVFGLVMTVAAELLAHPLAHLFVGYDRELFDMTVHAFRIFSFVFLLCGINIFASSFFTALGNGAVSAAISFLRTLVFQMLTVLLLPLVLGLDGVWWSVAVAEVIAFSISLFFLTRKRHVYHYV